MLHLSPKTETRNADELPADLAQTWLDLVAFGSHREAAKMLGVTRMTLWRWLQGRSVPAPEVLDRLRNEIDERLRMTPEDRDRMLAARFEIPLEWLDGKTLIPSEECYG